MQYIEMDGVGGPEVLTLAEGDKPQCNENDVLIKVMAAGVNRPDVIQRLGRYPPPPGASPILGLEVAGEVVGLGGGVSRFQLGDRVCALTNGGGYAEYVAAPAGQCLPVPDGLSLLESAALPETFFTVWVNLFDRAQLKSGETLLIHGGSSGIGTTAIQIAAALGVRVFVTAGSADKCAACESLGAELAINYREQDYLELVRKATDDRGVDVILDMVGGEYIDKNIQLAAVDGRVVNIAYLQGSKAQVDFMPVMIKRLTVTGSTLRPRTPEVKAAIAADLERVVWPLIEAGKVKPQIAASFALAEAADAHRLMESSTHIGKIVLVVAQ